MKNIFLMLVIASMYTVIGGCTDNADDMGSVTLSDTFDCNEPIAVDSGDDQAAPGFLVYIDKDKKVSLIEEEFSNKYEDITIFSSFPKSNSFYANLSDETLKKIQCEADVIAIAGM